MIFRTSENRARPLPNFGTLAVALTLLVIVGCRSRSPSTRLTGATHHQQAIQQGLDTAWATLTTLYPEQQFRRFDLRIHNLHVVEGTQPGFPRGSVEHVGANRFEMHVPRNPDPGFFAHEALHLHLYVSGHPGGPRGDHHHNNWRNAFRRHP